MKLGIGTKLIVFAVAAAIFVGFAATLPAEAQTGEDGSGNITVLVLDYGNAGSTITAAWDDSQQCTAGYNIFIDGVDTSTVSLPDGATTDDSGRIHAASASSTATQVSATFSALQAAADVDHLSVSVFCGDDDGTGRLIATVDDIAVNSATRRPEQMSYSSGTSLGGLQLDGIDEAIGDDDSDGPGLLVADKSGRILPSGGTGDIDYSSIRVGFAGGDGRVGFTNGNGGDTHSSISTVIADSGTTGSTFTITWVDADTCSGSYNLHMDNIDSGTVVLPTGVTQDSTSGRVHLGAVLASATLEKAVTFTTIKAVSDGDPISLWIYCGDDDSGRKVESYELPVNGTSLRPIAGTYSSTPGITELQINGTAQSAFHPYKTHEEYIYIWNVGDADEATLKAVLNDGYSATYYGSTKTVYSVTQDGVDLGKYATWYINGTVNVSAAAAVEDDFQLEFDDNDPNGTDMFLLNVSRGDYHTGHHYLFFIIRKTTVIGLTETTYAEDRTNAVGTYSNSTDWDFSWKLSERTGDNEEDDKDDFTIAKNDNGNAVLSFASQPDYEMPTDSSSPADNVYHTEVLGWEVNPDLGYWYGNYYGYLDVQVTVTDVTE